MSTANNVVNLQAYKRKQVEEFYDTVDPEQVDREIAMDLVYDIIDSLEAVDVMVENDSKSVNDLLMLSEVIQGLMKRTRGEKHPMQTVTDTLIAMDEPGDALSKLLNG